MCPAQFKPLYYRRFVKGAFTVFSDTSHTQLFQDHLTPIVIKLNLQWNTKKPGQYGDTGWMFLSYSPANI